MITIRLTKLNELSKINELYQIKEIYEPIGLLQPLTLTQEELADKINQEQIYSIYYNHEYAGEISYYVHDQNAYLDLKINPKYQRKNLGTTAAKFIFDILMHQYEHIFIDVNSNNQNAIAFWSSLENVIVLQKSKEFTYMEYKHA